MQFMAKLLKGGDESGLLPPGTNLSINNKNVKIIEKIGEGGFATVYSAKDNQRKYAVKHCKCQSTEQIELIDHEIEVMEKVATSDHPNIVNYYGTSKKIYEAKDMMPRRVEYFILLEFMDSSLISYIKEHQQQNKKIPEKQLFELFLDIVNGVYLIHEQHPPIAHRDIKIDNVLITYINDNNKKIIRLKICDFGSCVDGTPKICHNTQEMNIESELIDRFTTPSYRSPEMIDLYQRKELSTKVDIWALGCVLFVLAYYEHPFPEGAKMSILDAKYNIPDKKRYSKKVTKLIKMMFNKDPTKRPTCKQMSQHLNDIISGGKGTLSSKSKKRSNSNVEQTQLHLSPKQNDVNRRKSVNAIKSTPTIEETKNDTADWNPFDDDDPFDDDPFDNNNGGGSGDKNVFQVANELKPKDVKQQFNPNGSNNNNISNGNRNGSSKLQSINEHNNNNDNNNNNNNGNIGSDDPFFSTDFAADFFGSDSNLNNKEASSRPQSAKATSTNKKLKKRKSGSKPKPIDSEVYNEHQRQSKRKKKREKPSRSRSKSPTSSKSKSNGKSQNRPTTPKVSKSPKSQALSQKQEPPKQALAQPQPIIKSKQENSQDPALVYGDQLAQLVSMGFNDADKNIKAILRAKGNVQVAVSILISG